MIPYMWIYVYVKLGYNSLYNWTRGEPQLEKQDWVEIMVSSQNCELNLFQGTEIQAGVF